MNKRYLYLFALAVIVLLGVFFRTYNFQSRYSFGWDQQDDAVKVMKMVSGEGFTLIGPRVAGPDSFFVPAWHYYFLTPFYWLMGGSPWAGAVAALFVGIATIFVYYFVAKKLWGDTPTLIASWGAALAYSILSWNVMYTPMLTAIIFYLGNKMFDDKKYIVPAIVLAFFSGTTHLVPATLLVMILIGLILLKKRPNLKTVISALLVGSLSLFPLLIFDLRHDFLNIKKIFEFVGGQTGSTDGLNFLAWRAYFRGFSFMSGFNFSNLWFYGERVCLLLFVFYGLFSEKSKNKKLWYLLWFTLPAVVLLFYHRNIPEYYFGIPIALFPLFIAKSTQGKNFKIAISFLFIVTCVQTVRVTREVFSPSLADKQAIVDNMISYSNDKKFNFSYDVAFGDEVGYPYLFTWRKKEPQNTDDAKLYTLIQLPEKQGEKLIYTRGGLGIIER